MLILHVQAGRCERLDAVTSAPAGFLWIDANHSELAAAPEAFQTTVQQACGARIHDLHMQDAVNLQHPSYFDSTSDYDMLVFRKLVPGEGAPLAHGADALDDGPVRHAHQRLHTIETRPITFFMFERVLITVRSSRSKTVETLQARLLEPRLRPPETESLHLDKQRLPSHPTELALRLLNGMVDRYLELRQPLTDRIDRWQRALLDPRVPFFRWTALLDTRIELRKLENLCEEQYDAIQELRDHYLDNTASPTRTDALLVRVNDVMEHVQRVLSHARRLEASAESAVQLHFSATAYRTNQVVRTLTVITAVFAPLTLIAGVFGMNFVHMPLLRDPEGFWVTLGAMGALSTALLLFFGLKRYLSDEPRWWRWWRRR